jgi:hypothetical protein
MHLLLALLLFAQPITLLRGYVTVDPVDASQWHLALDSGRWVIALGDGCDNLYDGATVDLLAGSGNVGILSLVGATDQCNVAIIGLGSEQPCAQVDGVCDPSAEPIPQE